MSLDPALVKSSVAVKGIYLLNSLVNFIGICMNVGLIVVTIKNRLVIQEMVVPINK